MSVRNIESLSEILEISYRYDRGPSEEGILLEDGINCQGFVHAFYRKYLGVRLPVGMRSSEIYEDTELFRLVDSSEEPQFGDLYLFRRLGETDHQKIHLAIYCEEKDESGQPLLVHANKVDGKSSVWPLSEFQRHRRYQDLCAIKRLRQASSLVKSL